MITENTDIDFVVLPGKLYLLVATGDFGGGTLTLSNVLNDIVVPDGPSLTAAGTTKLYAATAQMRVVLAGATDPEIDFGVTEVDARMVDAEEVDGLDEQILTLADPTGSAEAAQAAAIQRANHTGTQAHTTITGLGTAATSSDWLFQTSYGIVSGNSADAVAEANATAIATAFAASVSTGKPLVLTGQIYVKGQVLLAGANGTIFAHGAEIIQKDIAHNGLTLSTVTVPYGLRIFGLKVTGQESVTHNAAAIYGRRGDLSYLTSDIILRDCYLSYFRTGISMANVAKFQTDNVTIAYVRVGMDWDTMQTALCTMTRIVQGDGDAASVCWKTRGANFAIRIIGGEYGGSGFARFAEIADGAEMHFEAVNIEALSSAQSINITTGGKISLVDSRLGTTHAATGAVISASVTGTSGLPTIVWRNNAYVSSGRIVEIYGTPTRAPKVFGDQIKIHIAPTQGGTVSQTINSADGLLTGFDGDVPSVGTIGAGAMFLAHPSTTSSSYSSDAGATNPLLRYFDNRLGATKLGSMSNDMLTQVWATANQIQNATTAETDLISATIPARYSNSVGDTNHLEAFGTTAANANNKTIKVYLAGVAIIDYGAIAANNEPWKLEVTIHRGSGGSGQQKVVAVLRGGAAIGTIVKTSQTSPTATAAMVFKLTGTGTDSGDIIMLGGKAWWVRSATVLGS